MTGDLSTNPAGILPYRIDEHGQTYFLLGEQFNFHFEGDQLKMEGDHDTHLSDFGGFKKEGENERITAIRECWEETRGVLGNLDELDRRLGQGPPQITHNKYTMFMMDVSELNEEKSKKILDDFNKVDTIKGPVEFVDTIQLKWMKIDEVFKRIQNNNIDIPLRPCFAENLKINANKILKVIQDNKESKTSTIAKPIFEDKANKDDVLPQKKEDSPKKVDAPARVDIPHQKEEIQKEENLAKIPLQDLPKGKVGPRSPLVNRIKKTIRTKGKFSADGSPLGLFKRFYYWLFKKSLSSEFRQMCEELKKDHEKGNLVGLKGQDIDYCSRVSDKLKDQKVALECVNILNKIKNTIGNGKVEKKNPVKNEKRNPIVEQPKDPKPKTQPPIEEVKKPQISEIKRDLDFTEIKSFFRQKGNRNFSELSKSVEKRRQAIEPEKCSSEQAEIIIRNYLALLDSFREKDYYHRDYIGKFQEFAPVNKETFVILAKFLPEIDRLFSKVNHPILLLEAKLMTSQLPYDDRAKLTHLFFSDREQLQYIAVKVQGKLDEKDISANLCKRYRKMLNFINNELAKDKVTIPRWVHVTPNTWVKKQIQDKEIPVTKKKAYEGAWVSNRRERDEIFNASYAYALSHRLIEDQVSGRIVTKLSFNADNRWCGLQKPISFKDYLCSMAVYEENKEKRKEQKREFRALLTEQSLGHVPVHSLKQFDFMIEIFHRLLGCPNVPLLAWGLDV